MFLISPLSWCYYFAALIIPFTVLFNFAQQGYYPTFLRLGTCATIILASLPFSLLHLPEIIGVKIILGTSAIYFYSLIFLLFLLYFSRIAFAKNPVKYPNTLALPLTIVLYVITMFPSLLGIITVHQLLVTAPQKAIPDFQGVT